MNINFFLIFISAFSLGCNRESFTVTPSQDSSHFEFILYDSLSDTIIPPIKEMLEGNYLRILNDLQVNSMPVVKVKIWNDESHYLSDMQSDIGQSFPGSTGYVYSGNELRILHRSNAAQTSHHEFAHVVSLNVKSNFGNNPRWLWEAVAVYESNEFVDPKNISYMTSGNYPTITELNSNFNSGNRKIYEVGYILSEFIIASWGKEGLIRLIKSNGNTQSDLEISVQQFEQSWYQWIKEKYF